MASDSHLPSNERPSFARTMGPRAAAEFLQTFSQQEQIVELQAMLKVGGRVTNLAHGIAVELKIAEHEDIKEQMVTSLKLTADALAVGYGGMSKQAVSEQSPFAGKGPMYAAMGAIDDEKSAKKKLDES